jgi:F-type H+-transporting ATPase subunit epsilon
MSDPTKLTFEVVTPGRKVLSVEVDEVVLPSVDGYMGVQPGHAPLLAMLEVGEMSYRIGSERKDMTVTGGFAEVQRDSVAVLARASELAEEIDLQRAERAKQEAETTLDASGDARFKLAEYKLRRALTRIQVHERVRD